MVWGVNWIQAADDTGRFRALVNTVMNHLVAQKTMHFCLVERTVSFSWKIQPHGVSLEYCATPANRGLLLRGAVRLHFRQLFLQAYQKIGR
jgi:hypothetical protein